MAAEQRNLKRKSEDFIYEVSEKDLSGDDEETNKKLPSKIAKVDDEFVSKPQANSTPNLKTKTTRRISNKRNNMNEHLKKWDYDDNRETTNASVIEIEDSDKDQDVSVQIIEKTIPCIDLCEQSDLSDAFKTIDKVGVSDEEGEILEKTVTEMPIVENVAIVEEIDKATVELVEETETINITFGNQELSKSYQNKFMEFLKTFPEFITNINDLNIQIKCKPADETTVEKITKKKHKKKKAKKELFVLDTNPSNNDSNNVRYSRTFSIEGDKPQEDTPKQMQAQTCFNCGENHALRDCPEPKDFNRIAIARQKFSSGKSRVARYHAEGSKFPHLRPGLISNNLRDALGLKKNEIPSYIYGMRALGYPPGWLEEAKISHSSLRLFNINGEKVKETKEKKKRGLDPDRIVEYPGFNAPFDKGCHDDYRRYNVPPYSDNLRKEMMVKHFENISKESESETSDMDLDSEERANDTQTKIIIEEDQPVDSPSLIDLEQKKKQLIDEINASNFNQQNSQTSDYGTASQTEESENSNHAEPLIVVKSSALGTPILKSSSCYSRLPNADNFSVGVSPVIDFENLPNSTGKYEQMTGVLNKVRTTLKGLDNSKE